MLRILTIMAFVVGGLAALGCGGGKRLPASVDRPAPTMGTLWLMGSATGGEELGDGEIAVRVGRVEAVRVAGARAEAVGVLRRDQSAGLGLVEDMVVVAGLDDEATLEELIALMRQSRARWGLGIPEGTVVSVLPDFGDVRCEEGIAPAVLLDARQIRWQRGERFRNLRINRLARGSVYSMTGGHVAFAQLRGPGVVDDPGVRDAVLGELFEDWLQVPINTVAQRIGEDGNTVWIMDRDGRSMLLPAPGGLAVSNAILERQQQ